MKKYIGLFFVGSIFFILFGLLKIPPALAVNTAVTYRPDYTKPLDVPGTNTITTKSSGVLPVQYSYSLPIPLIMDETISLGMEHHNAGGFGQVLGKYRKGIYFFSAFVVGIAGRF